MVRRGARRKRKELARERIQILWKKALKNAIDRPDLSRAWVSTARRVASKARIKLPPKISRSICKNCGTIFIAGGNYRVRIRNNRTKHLTVTCKYCGTIRRFLVTRQA